MKMSILSSVYIQIGYTFDLQFAMYPANVATLIENMNSIIDKEFIFFIDYLYYSIFRTYCLYD